MLLIGFVMHPNLLKMEALQTVEQLIARFHNQPMYQIGINSDVYRPRNNGSTNQYHERIAGKR